MNMTSKVLKKSLCHYGPTNCFNIDSPIGEIEMISCPSGLHALKMKSEMSNATFDPKSPVQLLSQKCHDNGYTYKPAILAVEWLKLYFNSPQSIHLVPYPPICSSITCKGSFQEKVWQYLLKEIPFGQIISYGQLAHEVNNPLASRAVGTAMKNNPIPLVIPCHRVVRSDGLHGHYIGGDEMKTWLIFHEKINTLN